MASALVKRCQSTSQIVTATPKGSRGSLGRGEREIGPEHVLMGWMVRHSACVVNNVQVKGSGRTPYRSLRCKYYTGEVVPFGEMRSGRNHSETNGLAVVLVAFRSPMTSSSSARVSNHTPKALPLPRGGNALHVGRSKLELFVLLK